MHWWCIRVKADPHRVVALPHRIYLLLQQAAQHHDAAVAGRQVLFGMPGNGALADHSLVVAGNLAVLFFGQVFPQLAIQTRAHLGQLAHFTHTAHCIDAKAVVVNR